MYNYIKNIFPILLMISFLSCSSQQKAMKLQKKAPFTIESAFAQEWIGGQPDSGSGINVQITIQNLNKQEIEVKDFYFRGQKTSLEDNTKRTNGLFIAHFIKPAAKDFVMHKDPKKEAGNEPPELLLKLPVDLQKNEGIISYMENGKLYYFKLKNIVEKFPNSYPSAPQNRQ